MTASKFDRALNRLLAGQRIFQMPNGQWKFGGNKFVPSSVAQKLPLEPEYTNNRGWTAFWLTEEARRKLATSIR